MRVRVSSSGDSGDEFRFTRKAGIPFPMMGLIIPGSKTSRVRGGGRGLLLPQAAPVWVRHTRGMRSLPRKAKVPTEGGGTGRRKIQAEEDM
jgi:hypothetical protein